MSCRRLSREQCHTVSVSPGRLLDEVDSFTSQDAAQLLSFNEAVGMFLRRMTTRCWFLPKPAWMTPSWGTLSWHLQPWQRCLTLKQVTLVCSTLEVHFHMFSPCEIHGLSLAALAASLVRVAHRSSIVSPELVTASNEFWKRMWHLRKIRVHASHCRNCDCAAAKQ